MATRDIIVIGASAGGVEPVAYLVGQLPADLPASLFVVVHISPLAKSLLPEILSSKGPMPAFHISDGMPIQKGCIYVAKPDHHMMVQDGVVRLDRGPRQNMARPAIDALFESAAREHGARVIGVILSGQLDDGTAGLAAVKRAGGIAIVQDPKEADHAGMPRSAIENVDVDYVLPVAEIPPLLAMLATKPSKGGAGKPSKGRNPHSSAGSKGGHSLEKSVEITRQASLEDGSAPASESETGEAAKRGPVQDPDPPSALICPECGGAMRELAEGRKPEGKTLRFRCHVGHIFSPETLRDQKLEEIEDTVWAAIRVLKESAALDLRLAAKARKSGMKKASDAYEKEARETLQHADVLHVLVKDKLNKQGMA